MSAAYPYPPAEQENSAAALYQGPPPANAAAAAMYGGPPPEYLAKLEAERACATVSPLAKAMNNGSVFGLLGPEVKGIAVRQLIELTELMFGCETANKYDVYKWDPSVGVEQWRNGLSHSIMFRMRERSSGIKGFCIRQCCGPSRPFMLDIRPSEDLLPGAAAKDEAIVCDRPFRCTCCCLARPVIRLQHPALGDLCEVYNPCCCTTYNHWQFEVRKPTHEDAKVMPELATLPDVWYQVRGYMCQPGACCTCPSGACQRIVFNIYDPEDSAYENPIGSAAKVFSGCAKEMMTDADNFVLEFPPDAKPVQKAALMATIVLTDFLLFESNPKQRN